MMYIIISLSNNTSTASNLRSTLPEIHVKSSYRTFLVCSHVHMSLVKLGTAQGKKETRTPCFVNTGFERKPEIVRPPSLRLRFNHRSLGSSFSARNTISGRWPGLDSQMLFPPLLVQEIQHQILALEREGTSFLGWYSSMVDTKKTKSPGIVNTRLHPLSSVFLYLGISTHIEACSVEEPHPCFMVIVLRLLQLPLEYNLVANPVCICSTFEG